MVYRLNSIKAELFQNQGEGRGAGGGGEGHVKNRESEK